jgi:hypothetical protein
LNEANKGLDNVTNTAQAGRVLDANTLAQKLDQAKAQRELAGKEIQATKQQQQIMQTDKVAESKIDASKAKSEANDQTKSGQPANKEDNKFGTKEEDAKKKKDQEVLNADMQLILANKLRELKEKEDKERKEKEKASEEEKDKKDPKQKTRLRYRVQEGDNLSSIAAKFLNDSNMAAAIFHINRTVIPVTTYSGKSYAVPSLESIIWIPSDDDVSEFTKSGAGKEYESLGFAGVTYASAEDELMAKFGRRWYSPVEKTKPAETDSQKAKRRANIENALGLLGADKKEPEAAAEPRRRPLRNASDAAARRANIEKVLGPFAPENQSGFERLQYGVRLGESLKSISLKHPLLQSVDAWRLLAAVNGLSTETDAKGCPVAMLKRGMTLQMPTPAERDEFRRTGNLPKASVEKSKAETQTDFAPPVVAPVSSTSSLSSVK